MKKLVFVTVLVLAACGEEHDSEETPEPAELGTMTFDFTLCCSGLSIGYALWIEDSAGNYIDTVVHYGAYRYYANAAMPVWEAKRVTDLDGFTHASAYTGERQFYEWDGLDREGNSLPTGKYQLRLEASDWLPPNCLTTSALDLGDTPYMSGDANCNVQDYVRYDYQPRE